MKINRLELKDFRNCEHIIIDFTSSKALIIGKNAQGKTNILESIYLLSCLKSPRTAVMSDMINFKSDKFNIDAVIEKNDTSVEIEINYETNKKRELKIDKVKTSLKDFKAVVKTVLFSTKDLLLLRGAPQDRRDWLDRAISQIYPAYDERLSIYDKIRIQKNNLLKNEFIDEKLLDIYNEQLVITGANIIFLRKKFLSEIEKLASDMHNNINNAENIKLTYSCPCDDVESISKYLTEELKNRKTEELGRRQSCVGPHRDDIEFKINDVDAVKYASQGQQRTLVLALKLAELEIIKEKIGTTPILLLDDVLAELDETRQNYLLKSIDNEVQTIITSVDTLLFDEEFLKKVQILSVENGKINM